MVGGRDGRHRRAARLRTRPPHAAAHATHAAHVPAHVPAHATRALGARGAARGVHGSGVPKRSVEGDPEREPGRVRAAVPGVDGRGMLLVHVYMCTCTKGTTHCMQRSMQRSMQHSMQHRF